MARCKSVLVLYGRAIVVSAGAVLSLAAAPTAASDGSGAQLTCTHPFSAEHPLVTGFLEPWANGITTDAQGSLAIKIVASETPGAECALAPVTGQVADVMGLPFALFERAEISSVIAYEMLAEMPDAFPGMLAAAAVGYDIVSVSVEVPPPLPGGLEGHAIVPPDETLGAVLDALGANTIAGEADVSAALAPMVESAGADWILTFDAGQSLYTATYMLSVSPERMTDLPAASRALVTQSSGRKLSAAAGRALDRARAVSLEAAQARGTHHSLAEDRVGAALSLASQVARAWATATESREADLARLERVRSSIKN